MAEQEISDTEPGRTPASETAASAGAWKAAKGHLVTLPSGVKVRFQMHIRDPAGGAGL